MLTSRDQFHKRSFNPTEKKHLFSDLTYYLYFDALSSESVAALWVFASRSPQTLTVTALRIWCSEVLSFLFKEVMILLPRTRRQELCCPWAMLAIVLPAHDKSHMISSGYMAYMVYTPFCLEFQTTIFILPHLCSLALPGNVSNEIGWI